MTKDTALRLALEYVELVPDDRYSAEHIDQDALITAIKAALEAKDEPVALAWAKGYRMGIADERTSEANIGIAGFNAKVEPARENPYVTTQPHQEAKDEPVAIFKADLDGGYVDLLAFQGQPLSDNTLLYTTPPQQEAKHEPVAWAWRVFDPDEGHDGKWGSWHISDYKPPRQQSRWFQVVPLPSTTPPQRTWVGLTDEEFNDAINDKLTPECIALSIEAKLKEKNT